MSASSKRIVTAGTFAALFFGAALSIRAQQGQPFQPARQDQPWPPQSGNQTTARDPGVRANSLGSGQPLSNLTPEQAQFFQDGLMRFLQVDSVSGMMSGEPGKGLGPGYNATSCGSCHAQPAVGGSSPSANAYPNIGPNPQIQAASAQGATNTS
jgi:CxxC motif-containing protein (DUF1111 family)